MSTDPAKQGRRDQLLRLLLTVRDFQLALSALTFLSEETDWGAIYNYVQRRRLQCFETAFIVAYARPFSQARGKGRPFTWKQIDTVLSEDEAGLHTRAIFMRNKVTAHSDAEHVEIRPTLLKLKKTEDDTLLTLGPVRFRDGLSLTQDDCHIAERLLHRALDLLFSRINKIRNDDPGRFSTIEIDL